MKRLVLVVLAILVVGLVATVVFLGYGKVSGKPSEADCRTVIQNRILEGNLGQTVEIVSYKTSDAYTIDFMGNQVHVVSFELQVRYLKQLDREVTLWGITGIAAGANILRFPSGPKGAVQKISGEMEFMQTDRGWRGQDGKFY